MDFFFRKFFKTKLKLSIILNRKIHTCSCVYTFVDNEGQKKNYSTKIIEQKSVKTTVVVL
jgi:F0F1-type ATP synthase alpha subunit